MIVPIRFRDETMVLCARCERGARLGDCVAGEELDGFAVYLHRDYEQCREALS